MYQIGNWIRGMISSRTIYEHEYNKDETGSFSSQKSTKTSDKTLNFDSTSWNKFNSNSTSSYRSRYKNHEEKSKREQKERNISRKSLYEVTQIS